MPSHHDWKRPEKGEEEEIDTVDKNYDLSREYYFGTEYDHFSLLLITWRDTKSS